jgi:hypothetical protein
MRGERDPVTGRVHSISCANLRGGHTALCVLGGIKLEPVRRTTMTLVEEMLGLPA